VVAYVSRRMRRLARERGNVIGNRPGGGGKCVENRKKILNSGNEPKNLLKAKELAFLGAKNELVFERKKGQSKPKKRPRIHLLCGFLVKREVPGPRDESQSCRRKRKERGQPAPTCRGLAPVYKKHELARPRFSGARARRPSSSGQDARAPAGETPKPRATP